MFASASFIVFIQCLSAAPQDEMTVGQGVATLELNWSDVEDRLQGSIDPKLPGAGSSTAVSAHVGTFEGPEFDGALTFSLKPEHSQGGGFSQTVKRAPGEKAWRTTFIPPEAGLYRLEISFSTTRRKVAHATFEVVQAKLPRWPWWILVGVTFAVAMGLGLRAVFKQQENT